MGEQILTPDSHLREYVSDYGTWSDPPVSDIVAVRASLSSQLLAARDELRWLRDDLRKMRDPENRRSNASLGHRVSVVWSTRLESDAHLPADEQQG